MTQKAVDVTLPDSGVIVHIKRIGPVLANDIRKRLKRAMVKPVPPMQEVLIGDDKKLEPNEAHPDYLAAMQEYQADMGMRFIEELVRYGIEVDVDAALVASLREMDDDGSLPKSDLVVYMTRIAISSAADMQTLQDAILGRFQPTEKAVAEATESFPDPVQGA